MVHKRVLTILGMRPDNAEVSFAAFTDAFIFLGPFFRDFLRSFPELSLMKLHVVKL